MCIDFSYNRVSKTIRYIKSRLSGYQISFFSVVSIVITFIGDLMQPVFELITVICPISIILGLFSFFAAYWFLDQSETDPNENTRLVWSSDACIFFSISSIFLIVCLLFQYNVDSANAGSEVKDQGILATLIPRLAEVQKSLGLINNSVKGVKKETSDNPAKEIVNLTGSYSVQGFVDSIFNGTQTVLDLYLKSGMKATTMHKGASAILYGFQQDLSNDPIAILKIFQANGFNYEIELTDGYILKGTSDLLPLKFETSFASKNYTGGYWGGKFAGPLMLWIVSIASFRGATDNDLVVLKYLINQGADCSASLSYLEFNKDSLGETDPFKELYPLLRNCSN